MKRYDGRRLKSVSPFDQLYPYLLTRRSEAQVFSKQVIYTDTIDAYIRQKRLENIKLSYLHVFAAAYVRVFAQRPKLNRFVMNSRLYARSGIFISMVVKHALDDEGTETTVKFPFSGHENIFDVIDVMNRIIGEAKKPGVQDDADKLVARLMSMPGFTKKALISFIKFLDRHNMLPRNILEVSPFHTTLFLTYLKSINTDYVYHHPYNIGTSGIFAAIGKTGKMPAAENDSAVVRNCCEIGYTFDDRICDGLYLANSLTLFRKYLDNPYLLETPLKEITEDVK